MLLARLTAVLDGFDVVGGSADDLSSIDVQHVHYDSRRVAPRSVFCCLVGDHVDGHDYAAEAVGRGAVAVLVERPVEVDPSVIQIRVDDARRGMALMAAEVEGNPSASIDVIGITGTNGKTTTAYLVQSVLDHVGRRTGVIGTLTGARTTPEAPDLQRQLRELRDDGHAAVAMEVSSHALALHRVDGTRFRVAVFTNLGRDHLDFHADMESYFEAKARLFTPDLADCAVICADDPYGQRLLDTVAIPATAFSCVGAGDESRARIDDLTHNRFVWRERDVDLPLGGRFNRCNAIAAAEAAFALGIAPDDIVAGLAEVRPVPGRFEPVDGGQDFTVLVDYAHTPDGLEELLRSVAELTSGRVITVFGCGGERDQSKRAAMGAVASQHADQVIVTSDNPRGEDPMSIIDQVRAGVGDGPVEVEPDRRRAIARALAAATAGDAVVIAGKGHEDTQIIGDRVVPFDDRVVAGELLAVLAAGEPLEGGAA